MKKISMKIDSNMIRKGFRCLRQYGLIELALRARERAEAERVPYDAWYKKRRLTDQMRRTQREESGRWQFRPLVSICVPLFCTPEKYLCDMIESVREQTYANWQLCLADGTPDDSVERVIRGNYHGEPRILYERLGENHGIAENTNAAFALADGEWIGLLDHDDLLAPEALYEMVLAAKTAGADAVYSDEDKVSEDLTRYFQPHWKPDFNPELLCSNNYITHFFMVKREIVRKVGGFRGEFDGAQDYDFIFRCTDAADRVAHVPRILYHWRASKNSTADHPESKMYAYEAGRRAVEEHLRANGVKAQVLNTKSLGFYRVKEQPEKQPLISVILLCSAGERANDRCARDIAKSRYPAYEVIRVEADGRNRARRCNAGAALAKGEYLLFLDGHMRKFSEEWMEELCAPCMRDDVGAVGCKLLYPNGRILHAGIVLGGAQIIHYVFAGMRGNRYGYMRKAALRMNYSAVSGLCMLTKRAAFDAAGGFHENLQTELGAVDFCLRLRRMGFSIVYTPYATAQYTGEDPVSLRYPDGEAAYMREHWAEILERGDFCYNPNLSLEKADYSLK